MQAQPGLSVGLEGVSGVSGPQASPPLLRAWVSPCRNRSCKGLSGWPQGWATPRSAMTRASECQPRGWLRRWRVSARVAKGNCSPGRAGVCAVGGASSGTRSLLEKQMWSWADSGCQSDGVLREGAQGLSFWDPAGVRLPLHGSPITTRIPACLLSSHHTRPALLSCPLGTQSPVVWGGRATIS